MKFNSTKIIAVVSSLFLLYGCTSVSTHTPKTRGSAETPSLPQGLPADAATHDPAAQHTLMKRGLYLDARGEIRSLASEEPITEPELTPAPVTRRVKKEAPPERRFEPVLLPIPDRQHD